MQNGGCHPIAGCRGPLHIRSAPSSATSPPAPSTRPPARPCCPPTRSSESMAVPVAFIGLTLRNTPNVVSPPQASRGWNSATRPRPSTPWCRSSRQRGIEAIVVLIHEGGFPSGDYNECPGISGPIVAIVGKLDKAVDLVAQRRHASCLTNACPIDGRLVTSGDKFGTIVNADRAGARSQDPRRRQRQGRQPDRPYRGLCQGPRADRADRRLRRAGQAAGRASRRIGSPRRCLRDCEGPGLGRKRARSDRHRRAAGRHTGPEYNGGAAIAFTNTGGIRTSLARSARTAWSPTPTCSPSSPSAMRSSR